MAHGVVPTARGLEEEENEVDIVVEGADKTTWALPQPNPKPKVARVSVGVNEGVGSAAKQEEEEEAVDVDLVVEGWRRWPRRESSRRLIKASGEGGREKELRREKAGGERLWFGEMG